MGKTNKSNEEEKEEKKAQESTDIPAFLNGSENLLNEYVHTHSPKKDESKSEIADSLPWENVTKDFHEDSVTLLKNDNQEKDNNDVNIKEVVNSKKEPNNNRKFSIWTGGREEDDKSTLNTSISQIEPSSKTKPKSHVCEESLTDEEVVDINEKSSGRYSEDVDNEEVMKIICNSNLQHNSHIALSSSPHDSSGDEIEVVKTPKSAVNLMKTVTVDFVYSPQNLSLNSVSLSSSIGKTPKVRTPKSLGEKRNSRPLSADIEGTPSSRQSRHASFSFTRSSPSPRHSPYFPRESRSVSPSHHVDDFVSNMPPASMFSISSCQPSGAMTSCHSLNASNGNKLEFDSFEGNGHFDGFQSSNTIGNCVERNENRYSCRNCSFSANSFAQYQHHLTRHESPKCLKCPVCEFSTNDRNSLRRHRRVHMGASPANIIRCDRCDFSTVLPRKYREHLAQAHDMQLSSSHYGFQYQSPILRQGISSTSDRINPLDLTPHAHSTPLSQRVSSNHPVNSYIRGVQSNLPFKESGHSFVPREGIGAFSTFGVPPNNHLASHISRHLTPSYVQPMTSSANNPVHGSQAINGSLPSGSRFFSQQQFNVHVGPGQVKIKQEPPDSPQGCHAFTEHKSGGIDRPVRRVLNNSFQNSQARQNAVAVDFSARSVTASFDLNRSQVFDPIFVRSRDRLSFHQHPHSNIESYELPRPSRSRLGGNHLFAMETPRSRDGNDTLSGHCFDRSRSRSRSRSRNMGDNSDQTGHRYHDSTSLQAHLEGMTVKQEPGLNARDTEMPSVGIQCRIPSVKAESQTNASEGRENANSTCTDQAVQCEILSATVHLINTRALNNDNESDYSNESQSFPMAGHRCNHCGITFDDEVLFSIHIGCHSHTDPFVCNVCGKHCGNKYGFYSHIMRGHHF